MSLQVRHRRAASMALVKALLEEPDVLDEEQDPEDQDMVFENIPKGDPKRSIRWGTDKHIDRKLITLRLAVGKGFCRGFLPHLNDVIYIFERLEFPFDMDQAFVAEMIKKWCSMMQTLVNPANLGNGFELKQIDDRGTKRLRITKEFERYVFGPEFRVKNLGVEVPATRVVDVDARGLAIDVSDDPYGTTHWVAKAVQVLRGAGIFRHQRSSSRPMQYVVQGSVASNPPLRSPRPRAAVRSRQHSPGSDSDSNYNDRYIRGREETAEAEFITPGARAHLDQQQRNTVDQLDRQLQAIRDLARRARVTNVPLFHLLQNRGHDVDALFQRVTDLNLDGAAGRRGN